MTSELVPPLYLTSKMKKERSQPYQDESRDPSHATLFTDWNMCLVESCGIMCLDNMMLTCYMLVKLECNYYKPV